MLLALDLSTSTGWALFSGDRLIQFDTLVHKAGDRQNCKDYPRNMIVAAEHIAADIEDIIDEYPDIRDIVIEESNIGVHSDRFATKQSEFIHFTVASMITGKFKSLHYLDTSRWQSIIKILFSKEQRLHNRLVKDKQAKGRITRKHLVVAKINKIYNTKFLMKDNDITDAIGLGSAYLTIEGSIPESRWEE